MTNINPNTGKVYEYAEYRQEAIKPRRTQRAQRQEIESSLDRLTAQGDFASLDIIRKAAAALAQDTPPQYDLLFRLRESIEAKPGEWIIRQVKE